MRNKILLIVLTISFIFLVNTGKVSAEVRALNKDKTYNVIVELTPGVTSVVEKAYIVDVIEINAKFFLVIKVETGSLKAKETALIELNSVKMILPYDGEVEFSYIDSE